jgi:hypothetical protein
MIASDVTLLPQPDSPTEAERRALATLRSTLSTACVVRPSSPWKSDAQVLDFDQRACVIFARDGRFDRGVDDRAIGDAGRILARRQELAEMHPALAAHLFEAFELGKRIGVVVDAQIERRPFLLAVDHKRRRLLAALVAAGGFARSHRRDQPLRERQACFGT